VACFVLVPPESNDEHEEGNELMEENENEGGANEEASGQPGMIGQLQRLMEFLCPHLFSL
jgi:hypothetical protein